MPIAIIKPMTLTTMLPAAALSCSLLLLLLHPVMVMAYTPFGYQSDSTHSWEFRTKIDNPSADNLGLDPSSFAGSVHYDPLHHALYLTGATFGSGPGVFDGVDVFELTTTEQNELHDQDPTNNGYWWVDMATGLKPNLLDVGIPRYSPANGGDCFYAVMGLPTEISDEIPINPDSIINATLDPNRVKLLHSRRFGSDGNAEACSALDVLFASRNSTAPGGYDYDFDQSTQEYTYSLAPQASSSPPPFGPPSPSSSPMAAFTEPLSPSMPPVSTTSTSGMPTAALFMEGGDIFGSPTATGMPSPTPAPVVGGGRNRRGLLRNNILHAERGEEREMEIMAAVVRTGKRMEHRSVQTNVTTTVPSSEAPVLPTRSVRLLMAGHVELPQSRTDGYVVADLPVGQYNEATVYAFAQQVDVRLPSGDLLKYEANQDVNELLAGDYAQLDYSLHDVGTEEDELAQELDKDFMSNIPQSDFEGIVTSGVESRALLNDGVASSLRTIYPVALVADSTTKAHYYVVLMASENAGDNRPEYSYLNMDPTIGDGAAQRGWTEYPKTDIDAESTGDYFGQKSRPNFGSNFRIVVKKMWIQGNADPDTLTDAEENLAATSYDSGGIIVMRHSWTQEYSPDLKEDARPTGLLFAPSGSADGSGDLLILVGTTAGRGSAFGTASEESVFSSGQEASVQQDLDGFVTKIRADNGAFAGRYNFDTTTNQFENTFSLRIATNPGNNEIVAGVCAKPPLAGGMMQEEVSYIYVVGSTSGVLTGVSSDLRSDDFLSSIPVVEDGSEVMEAFLMKVDLSTMRIVWTVQIGAITSDRGRRVNAHGYGCTVTLDGEDVYLTGLVKEDGVATDFSEADNQGGFDSNSAAGGTDIFISSYKTEDGSRTFLKQVGSNKDDFPSRGKGGITSDRTGNAIITGNTRGGLMRKRREGEFIYGSFTKEAAMDVFVMSFDRENGNHVPIGTGSVSEDYQETLQESEQGAGTNTETGATTDSTVSESTDSSAESQTTKTKNSALVGAVAFAMAFIILSVIAAGVVVYRIKSKRKKEKEAIAANGNLRRPSTNLQSHRRNTWKVSRDKAQMNNFTNDLNMAVEVRNSASGGWHGIYGEEQLQSIDFGTSGGDKNDVVQQSLFMDDALDEIEGSSAKYVIGEMDDVSDEDLIKAYNDAMAVEIEPESPDVEFAMQGVGSIPVLEKDDHKFT